MPPIDHNYEALWLVMRLEFTYAEALCLIEMMGY